MTWTRLPIAPPSTLDPSVPVVITRRAPGFIEIDNDGWATGHGVDAIGERMVKRHNARRIVADGPLLSRRL